MNPAIQGESSNAPPVLPLKRGRGRPRKDPSLKRVGRPRVHPVSERALAIQPQVPTNNVNDAMIGQAVTGVVEAAFDAGYLLNVRIGDSNTNFRGVVFKPGHFVPVTAANDVAPHLQMIKRNEVHPPAENRLQVYGHNRSGQRPEQNGAVIVGSRSSKSKQAGPAIHPSVPPVGARGTVVPVVLQPINLMNESPSSQDPRYSSQVSNMESVRERDVQVVAPLAVLPPDGSMTNGQAPIPTCETSFPSQNVSHEVAMGTGQNEDGSPSKEPKIGLREEVKPVVSTDVRIPVEATKGSQGSPLSPNTDSRNHVASHELSAELSCVIPERNIGDMNELPSKERSEPMKSPLHIQATSVSKPLMNYGTGRMTELLQAVQENLMENQMLHGGEPAIGLAVTKSLKTEQ